MQAKRSRPSAAEQDKRMQRALLALALYEFPNHLHRRDLVGQMYREPLEKAVLGLVTAELLFCEGEEMLPTLPARHFDWLEL